MPDLAQHPNDMTVAQLADRILTCGWLSEDPIYDAPFVATVRALAGKVCKPATLVEPRIEHGPAASASSHEMSSVYVHVNPAVATRRTQEVNHLVRIDRGLDDQRREVVVGVEVLEASSVEIDGEEAETSSGDGSRDPLDPRGYAVKWLRDLAGRLGALPPAELDGRTGQELGAACWRAMDEWESLPNATPEGEGAADAVDLVAGVIGLRGIRDRLRAMSLGRSGPTGLYADLVIDLNAALANIEPHRCTTAVEVSLEDDSAVDEDFEFVAFAGGDDPGNATIVQSFGMDRAAAEEHARWLVEGGVAFRRDPQATARPWGLIEGWQDPNGESWMAL